MRPEAVASAYMLKTNTGKNNDIISTLKLALTVGVVRVYG